jgi:hypothetical protein
MIMENVGEYQRCNEQEKYSNDPVSQLLMWSADFLPILWHHAGRLGVPYEAVDELMMAREVFMGSICPCHQFHEDSSVKERFMLFHEFERAARVMVEWIDHHPAMTDDLRKQMGILEFHAMKSQK